MFKYYKTQFCSPVYNIDIMFHRTLKVSVLCGKHAYHAKGMIAFLYVCLT